MHVGTALAVMIYFRSRVLELLRQAKLTLVERVVCPYIYNFSLATLTTVILAFLMKDLASKLGRQPGLIALNLVVFGLLMYLTDLKKKSTNFNPYKHKDPLFAVFMGIFQVLAVFPGVSRSGVTLTFSRLKGLSRQLASDFSFLLSLPIILGGFFYEVTKNFHQLQFDLATMTYGIFISFIVGIFTIHFFLKFIKSFGFLSFFIYRLMLSLIIFIYLF